MKKTSPFSRIQSIFKGSLACLVPTIFALSVPIIAAAYEIPSSPANTWTGTGNGVSTKSTISGLRVNATVSGATTINTNGRTNTVFQTQNVTNVPTLPATTNGLWVLTTANSTCSDASINCGNLGSLTFRFTDSLGFPIKVRNPVMHISRLGGFKSAGTNYYSLTAILNLTTSGVTMGNVTTGSRGMHVINAGTTLEGNLSNWQTPTVADGTFADGFNHGTCTTSAQTTGERAGCGSVPINGTISEISFNLEMRRTNTSVVWTDSTSAADAYLITFSFEEDFGDAPSSYEAGNPAVHTISDLRLGTLVAAENLTTANGGAASTTATVTTSPAAGTSKALDSDGLSSVPSINSNSAGSPYTLTPTISGTSRPGKVCGWIDFNRSGTFDASEGTCTSFAAGDTSAPLNWTIPNSVTGTNAGMTVLRLRVSYDETPLTTSKFNGPASSGEVEDYPLEITPSNSDMAVTLSGFPLSVSPGSTVTGKITCAVQGPATAVDATCGATGLPAGAQLVCTPIPPTNLLGGERIVCDVSFTAPSNGSIAFTATTGASNDTVSTNNSAPGLVKVIDAADDSSATIPNSGATIPLLGNDSLGGSPATLGTSGNIRVPTIVSGAPLGSTIDPVTGALVVPPGTPAGNYNVRYKICAVDTPTACDEAVLSINVPQADMSVSLSGFPASAAPGSTVSGTMVCTAAGNNAISATCAATNLPAGATVSCNPSPPTNLLKDAKINCSVSFTAPSSGIVNVTGNTGASNDGNPNNNVAVVPVKVIDAVNEAPVTLSQQGGSIALLGNDTLSGSPAVIGADGINPPTIVSGAPAGAFISPTGQLVIPSGTAPGTYNVTYQICAQDTPTACDTAIAVVNIPSANISASVTGFPASASPGSTVTGQVICTASGNTLFDATCVPSGMPVGAVVSCLPLTPTTLAAGQQIVCSVSYTAPQNGVVTIVGTAGASNDGVSTDNVAQQSIKVIDAINDSATLTLPTPGGVDAQIGLLGNDTLGGSAASLTNVTLPVIVSSDLPGASINPTTGALIVPGNTAAGQYSVRYRICAVDTPTACDEAVATLQIPAADMSVTVAGFPSFVSPGSIVNGTVTCLASGNTAVAASCKVVGVPAGATVNCTPTPPTNLLVGERIVCNVQFTAPLTGSVNVQGITDANNDSVPTNNVASANVQVIDAVNDASVMLSTAGGTVNLLGNDTLGGLPVAIGVGGISAPTIISGAPLGSTVDPQGRLVVPNGTAPGTYNVVYKICVDGSTTICDEATAVISIPAADMSVALSGFPVSAAPGSLITGRAVCTASGNTSIGATCGVTGLPVGATVVCTPTPPRDLSSGASIVCEVSFTAPASGLLNIVGNTSATNDTVPANNTAQAPIKLIDAVDNPLVTVSSAGALINVLGNDTFGGNPAVLGAGGVTAPVIVDAGGLPNASFNAAGELVVAPGTPAGTYPVQYKICAVDRLTACDIATVPVTVKLQAIVGVKYLKNITNPGQALTAGAIIEWTVVYQNADSATINDFQITDVMDTNLRGVSIASVSSASGLSANTAYTGVAPNDKLLTSGGALKPGDTVTVQIRAQIVAGFTGDIANQAAANAPSFPAPVLTSAVGPTSPACPSNNACIPVGIVVPPVALGGQPTAPNSPNRAPVVLAASLSGKIWVDANGDRTRQADEKPAAGYKVIVYRLKADGTRDVEVTDPNNRPTTDANGNYTVPNLVPTLGSSSGGASNGGSTIGPKYEVAFQNPAGSLVLGVPASQGADPALNGTVPSSRDRISGISLTPGNNTAEQNLPLDPAGVVYDSVTRQAIAGATVTLQGPSGFDPAIHVVGGVASQVTGTDGMYQFLLTASAPPGQYSLAVTPTNSYVPSQSILPTSAVVTPGSSELCTGLTVGQICQIQPQPGAPQLAANASTKYYLAFNLTPGISPDVVHNHIPMDPAQPAVLAISKVASKTEVEIGDSVKYTIRVKNLSSSSPALNVQVIDSLPIGFHYVPQTTRGQGTPPVRLSEPAGSPGPQLNFSVGTLAANGETSFSYFVRIGALGADGDGINRAFAQSGAVRSLTALAKVSVRGGVLGNQACVVGKIFADCGSNGVGYGNGNAIQDRGEAGIPGVRIYLQDGTYVISDSEGKYSVCGLEAKTHVFKVDQTTLPKGSRLGTTANLNAADASSLFVDLKNGQLARADFRDMSCNRSVFDEIRRRVASMPKADNQDVNRSKVEGVGVSGSAIGLPTAQPGNSTGATQVPSVVPTQEQGK
jgi:uncharacterized repeat protein (TIGR01451 family)